jgi:hypothetical protein
VKIMREISRPIFARSADGKFGVMLPPIGSLFGGADVRSVAREGELVFWQSRPRIRPGIVVICHRLAPCLKTETQRQILGHLVSMAPGKVHSR